MSDSIRKELIPHDIARLFAEDVKRYADAIGPLDDLSATNVYNVLEGYEQKDSFKESMKDIERINSFIDDDVQIKILPDALKETETKLNNSLKAIQMGIINKSIADMISSLEKDKDTMQNELLGSKARQKSKSPSNNAISSFFLWHISTQSVRKTGNSL